MLVSPYKPSITHKKIQNFCLNLMSSFNISVLGSDWLRHTCHTMSLRHGKQGSMWKQMADKEWSRQRKPPRVTTRLPSMGVLTAPSLHQHTQPHATLRTDKQWHKQTTPLSSHKTFITVFAHLQVPHNTHSATHPLQRTNTHGVCNKNMSPPTHHHTQVASPSLDTVSYGMTHLFTA